MIAMKKYDILIGVVIAMIVGVLAWRYIGGQDPHAFQLTEQNKDSFMDILKDSKGLSLEEAALLSASQVRRRVAVTLGREPDSIVGQTVGDLIAAERQLQADAKIKDDEEKRLAADAKAEADASAAELRRSLTLTVFDKDFTPSNADVSRYSDYITIKCVYANTSGKNIRAFRGTVQFTDLFGKQIFASNLTISDPINAGAKQTWTGEIKYNQFLAEHLSLRNTDLQDMKIVWLPASILFADGTQIGAADEPK
jgi:hypothetical protein